MNKRNEKINKAIEYWRKHLNSYCEKGSARDYLAMQTDTRFEYGLRVHSTGWTIGGGNVDADGNYLDGVKDFVSGTARTLEVGEALVYQLNIGQIKL